MSIDYRQIAKEKTERLNIEIARCDELKVKLQTALAAKYGLSTSRVHLIIQDMQRNEELAAMLEEAW